MEVFEPKLKPLSDRPELARKLAQLQLAAYRAWLAEQASQEPAAAAQGN